MVPEKGNPLFHQNLAPKQEVPQHNDWLHKKPDFLNQQMPGKRASVNMKSNARQSIFEGTRNRQLKKIDAIKKIAQEAKTIAKSGYNKRQKYGIDGSVTNNYGAKKFAKKFVDTLPNKSYPSLIEEREVKKAAYQTKLQKLRDERDFKGAEVKEAKKRLKFLDWLMGKK